MAVPVSSITPGFITSVAIGTVGSVGAGATTEVTITVKGARAGRFYHAYMPALETGFGIVHIYASAKDTIKIRLSNGTAGSVTPDPAQAVNILMF